VDSSWGRTCSTFACCLSISLTYFLMPVFPGAPKGSPFGTRRREPLACSHLLRPLTRYAVLALHLGNEVSCARGSNGSTGKSPTVFLKFIACLKDSTAEAGSTRSKLELRRRSRSNSTDSRVEAPECPVAGSSRTVVTWTNVLANGSRPNTSRGYSNGHTTDMALGELWAHRLRVSMDTPASSHIAMRQSSVAAA
jgi:hypothetical protein